jgi:pimeloyl-ACP methyl ester carboxylesterase
MREAIPEARLVMFYDSSHHVFLTRSEECARETLRFLQQLS